MKIYNDLNNLAPQPGGTVLTIGNFDGVHRAHQRLIETARALTTPGCPTVTVLTFEPHPLSVVAPGREPPRLTTLAQKLDLLEHAGADVVVCARSEPTLLGMEPEDFVRDVVQARFAPRHIVEGGSFGFGKARRGDTDLLKTIAAEFDCRVHVVDEVTVTCDRGDRLVVSSSLIRRLLSEGDAARAALCLGRPYILSGRVVRGEARGRTLGFPTANIAPDEQLIPADGVYAGTVLVEDQSYRAGISIGRTPTFDGAQTRIEAHLLDFQGDLYDQRLSLTFEQRIRSQKKFASPDELIDQIRQDVEFVRRYAAGQTHKAPHHAPMPSGNDQSRS